MAQKVETLGDFLPYVRRAIDGKAHLTYSDFADAVLMKLAENGVIEKPRDFGYSGLHSTLKRARPLLSQFLVQSFFNLLRNEYIVPASNAPNEPNFHSFFITARGKEWVNGGEPMPEDVRGYMTTVRGLVPKLDAVVEQYIEEAVLTYDANRYFAAAVMVGAASEKIVYVLAASLEKALQDAAQKKRVANALSDRSLPKLLGVIGEVLEHNKKKLPRAIAEGIHTHLLSFFESIRVQRNEAVHPAVAKVSQDQVRLALAAFPNACATAFALVAWLQSNPL